MGKVRVYELGKELGIPSSEAVARLRELGEYVKGASSTVEQAAADKLRRDAAAHPFPAPSGTTQSGAPARPEPGTVPPAPAPAPAPVPGRNLDVLVSPDLPDAVVKALASRSENQRVEFKAGLDSREGQPNRHLHLAVAKTVAGFANSSFGGLLLIGVNDDGNVVGLNFSRVQRQNADGYLNRLAALLTERLTGPAWSSFVEMDVWTVPDAAGAAGHVASVRVRPATKPVWVVGDGDTDTFWLRQGARTEQLAGSRLYDYVTGGRFPAGGQ